MGDGGNWIPERADIFSLEALGIYLAKGPHPNPSASEEKGMSKIKIGWVPWCTWDEDGLKNVLGPWPAYFSTDKREASRAKRNCGFKFKILPVYVEKP